MPNSFKTVKQDVLLGRVWDHAMLASSARTSAAAWASIFRVRGFRPWLCRSSFSRRNTSNSITVWTPSGFSAVGAGRVVVVVALVVIVVFVAVVVVLAVVVVAGLVVVVVVAALVVVVVVALAVVVVVVLVVLALSLYARYRIRRKDSEIANYVETIESLRMDIERIPRDMASSITTLYRDRFSELNELCDIYYDHSGSSRHKNLVFNKVLETIEAIKGDSSRIDELGAMVDNYRENALQRLKSALPRLSERDYRVALYSFAGFSNRAIALFIDSDPVAVSKIKYSIKYKLKGVESIDCEQLISLLSDK